MENSGDDGTAWRRRGMPNGAIFSQTRVEFWHQYLKGAPAAIPLPTDRRRSSKRCYTSARVHALLSPEVINRLKILDGDEPSKLTAYLICSVAALIKRWTGHAELLIGMGKRSRHSNGLSWSDDAIENVSAVNLEIDKKITVSQLLKKSEEAALAVSSHCLPSLTELSEILSQDSREQKTLQIFVSDERSSGETQCSFEFDSSDPESSETVPGHHVTSLEMQFILNSGSGRTFATVEYATELFNRDTAKRISAWWSATLETIAVAPKCDVNALVFMSEIECGELVSEKGGSKEIALNGKVIHELLEEQALCSPERIAASLDEHWLTFFELNSRANRLARYLKHLGLMPEMIVGLCMGRTLELILAMVGVLKAGGVYLALDPEYPSERLSYILQDARPRVVLFQGTCPTEVLQSSVSVLDIDELMDVIINYDNNNIGAREAGLSLNSAAYMIYTSGSTGIPKGVVNEHRGLVNRIRASNDIEGFDAEDLCCQKTSIGFVDSMFEIFGALCTGTRLVFAPTEVARDPAELAVFIARQGITRLITVPSLARAILDISRVVPSLSSLKSWTLSGEEVRAELVKRIQDEIPGCEVIAIYGSSEVSADATYYKTMHLCGDQVPLGRALPNTRIYVLEPDGKPSPIGIVGEVFVGGAAVGRGYLGRPDLTAERYIANRYDVNFNSRLFKTGDLARWKTDGSLEYLGRSDNQVKIRGVRIELGEIESHLLRRPDVENAVVIVREDISGDKRLVAYVSFRDKTRRRVGDLRSDLRPVLPSYMMPGVFVVVDSWPFNRSGKLDRRALPYPEREGSGGVEYEPLRGHREECLGEMWKELLGVERVGRNDNFFELGGHSLLVAAMSDKLRLVGLLIATRDIYSSQTLAELALKVTEAVSKVIVVPENGIPSSCDLLSPEMIPLVTLTREHLQRIISATPGGAANVQDIYPLAPLQEGLFFHHMLGESKEDAYVRPILLEIESQQLLNKFVGALQIVIHRHDALRTSILWEGLPRPLQVVWRKAELTVEKFSLSHTASVQDQLDERLRPQSQWLDLSRAPLMRLSVAIAPNTTSIFAVLQLHHMASDAVSQEIMLRELAAVLGDRISELPDPIPYRNHVARTIAQSKAKDVEAFFRQKLSAVSAPTTAFSQHAVSEDGVSEVRQTLPGDLAAAVRSQARCLGVTTAVLFHVAWSLVVAHVSSSDDVVFGTVLLGREEGGESLRRAFGMFINTLPLRIGLRDVSILQVVKRVQRELGDLLDYEQSALAVAQRCSGIEGSAPLFDALINFRHDNRASESTVSALSDGVRILKSFERTNYPFVLSVDDTDTGFILTLQTAKQINVRRSMGYLLNAIQSLIDALINDAGTPAVRLDIVGEEETRRILKGFNVARTTYPRDSLVQDIFESQVNLQPDAVAVTQGYVSITYKELSYRAARVAQHFNEIGVAPGEFVCVHMSRSLEMLVAQLAILKCGAAYVPIDPQAPVDRRSLVIRDSGAKVVVVGREFPSDLSEEQVRWVCSEEVHAKLGATLSKNYCRDLSASSAAYVMYTSGSTGTPKGVLVTHRGIVRLVINSVYIEAGSSDCVAHCSNPAFDASTFEVWVALMSGARLVIIPHFELLDAAAFTRCLVDYRISIVLMTTGLFTRHAPALGSVCHHLKYLIVGGDILEPGSARLMLRARPPMHLLNAYGPTECTVLSTTYAVNEVEDSAKTIPIGCPVANSQVYILNRNMQPVGMGVVGELYLGGDGISWGYLHRPALTAEKFVADPFGEVPGARLYQSGDLGRWREDGVIEFLGRNDFQVKIRGYRVELGEIEAELGRCQYVREAVVLIRGTGGNQKLLTAYVVLRGGSGGSPELLREHLSAALPSYMVPAAFVILEKLPLTPTGKVDRAALPDPDLASLIRTRYEEPVGKMEALVAEIWRDLLKVERISRADNFFELGGHSLLIVQMMERLRQHGLQIKVSRVYESETLADLARTLLTERERDAEIPPNMIPADCSSIDPRMVTLVDLEPTHIEYIVSCVSGGVRNIQDIYPLAPLQEGFLFHSVLDEKRGDIYVVATLLLIESRERLRQLIAAIQAEIDRHDVLRTSIVWARLPRPVQVVHRRVTLPVEETRLDDRTGEGVLEWMKPERLRLDLKQAPLMRIRIAADPCSERWYAQLIMHHIVYDATSEAILISEIVNRLEGRSLGVQSAGGSYRRHVAVALERAKQRDAGAFFKHQLADVDEPTVPFGLFDTRGESVECTEVSLELSVSLSRRLRTAARRAGMSVAVLFHSAWGLVVSRTAGRDDVVFGSVLLGRMRGDTDSRNVMGLFINTLPVRLSLRGITVMQLLEQTRDQLTELMNFEQTPLSFAKSCSGLSGECPLFSAVLNFRHSSLYSDAEWSSASGITELAIQRRSNYPMSLSVDELIDRFKLTARVALPADAARVARYMETTTKSLVSSLESCPDCAALTLEILHDEEISRLDRFSIGRKIEYASNPLIHEALESQVSRIPDRIAVVYENNALTFAELNERANHLAWYLRECGVGPEKLVGLWVERGLQYLIGIVAILKAGGAYVPLDPGYPPERLYEIMADARPLLILTDRKSEARRRVCAPVVEIKTLRTQLESYPADNPPVSSVGSAPNNLAYVIYTSGSTGRPKGVMIEHASVVGLWRGLEQIYKDVGTCERVGINASFNFDASVKQIVQVLSGRTLVLFPSRVRLDATEMTRFMGDARIDAIDCTPSQLKGWIAAGFLHRPATRPRLVLVGGEAIDTVLWEQLGTETTTEFYNVYGPTECTVDATYLRIGGESSVPSIGFPMENKRIYVCGDGSERIPIGCIGGLYIGGQGIARGYLNRPDLTANQFIPENSAAGTGRRMYATGDLALWQLDGSLVYCGRNDRQVKLRGFRVELAEVESRIRSHPDVSDVAVVISREGDGIDRLTAYVVGKFHNGGQSFARELRQYLMELIPDYMVPGAWVAMTALPLTSNGKLDKRALPAPGIVESFSDTYVAPRTDLERALAEIWIDLLRIDRVGITDSFMELGGHSLLLMRLAARIAALFSVEVPVGILFECQTIAQLAPRIEELRRERLFDEVMSAGDNVNEVMAAVTSMSEARARELLDDIKTERRAWVD